MSTGSAFWERMSNGHTQIWRRCLREPFGLGGISATINAHTMLKPVFLNTQGNGIGYQDKLLERMV
jgi:hypothetical protein